MGMQLIETIEVGAGGAASIEFTSIPQDGVDLVCVLSLRNSVNFLSSLNGQINFNGDTAGNYNSKLLFGNGSSASSLSISSGATALRPYVVGHTATANTFSNNSVYISNYTSSSSKSVSVDNVTENNATAAHQSILAGNWTGTTAITSINITSGFTWMQYSTASLYKITAD